MDCAKAWMVVNSRTHESGAGSASVRCAVSIHRTLRLTLRSWRTLPADRLPALSDRPERDCDKQDMQIRSSRNSYSLYMRPLEHTIPPSWAQVQKLILPAGHMCRSAASSGCRQCVSQADNIRCCCKISIAFFPGPFDPVTCHGLLSSLTERQLKASHLIFFTAHDVFCWHRELQTQRSRDVTGRSDTSQRTAARRRIKGRESLAPPRCRPASYLM
jgi:hypothetical protein